MDLFRHMETPDPNLICSGRIPIRGSGMSYDEFFRDAETNRDMVEMDVVAEIPRVTATMKIDRLQQHFAGCKSLADYLEVMQQWQR